MSELLSVEETASITGMLRGAGVADDITATELLLDRPNVLRVQTSSRAVVVKRARSLDRGIDRGSLQMEAAALTLCTAMPTAIAPRLLGFDVELGLVVMEELPPGRTLSELFLFADEATATDGLSSVASALASLHAYTSSRADEYAAVTADLNAPRLLRAWLDRAGEERKASLEAISSLVPTDGVDQEIDWVLARLATTPFRGLVHGDLCPDNVRLTDAGVRIFDFEASDYGPLALDAAYLLAPYPSCWCFAELPPPVAEHAFATYLDALTSNGVIPDEQFQIDVSAALACFLIAYLSHLPAVLADDDEWGTSTMRPRTLRWLTAFAQRESVGETLPRLLNAVRALLETLRDQWEAMPTPRYPAFAPPGEGVEAPAFWRPGL